MADLTPEQLDGLTRLAAVRDGIEKRMTECIARLDEDPSYTGDHFAMDSEMLRAVSLEFMNHATALAEAARRLKRVTSAMEAWAKCADDEAAGKPGSVGGFLAAEIRRRMKEALNGGT